MDLSSVIIFSATVALSCQYNIQQEQRRRLGSLEEDIAKQKKLREDERTARISLQKAKREQVAAQVQQEGYFYKAIAHVESPFPDRRGTPRQPSLVPAAHGFLRFDKHIVQRNHFEELGSFSHLWVLFVFHENTNTDKAAQIAKIKPPRLHGKKVGCLSTRSPHRPNNIGLSVCEIVRIGNDFIEVRGIDMVHGTPIIDVKPYIPYDIVPSTYALPMATLADGTPLPQRSLEVPSWVVDSDIPLLPVTFTDAAMEDLESVFAGDKRFLSSSQKSSKIKRITKSATEAKELIQQVLRQDIRSSHQGRGATTSAEVVSTSVDSHSSSSTPYICVLDGLQLHFQHLPEGIVVQQITPAAAATSAGEKQDASELVEEARNSSQTAPEDA